jgi:hypothetical protein
MYALVTLPVKVRARGHNCADRGRCPVPYPEESFVSGSEILLVALAILVPLAIAIAVTLWTLQPAVRGARLAPGVTPLSTAVLGQFG